MKKRNIIVSMLLAMAFGLGATGCGSASGTGNNSTDGSYNDDPSAEFGAYHIDSEKLDYDRMAEQIEKAGKEAFHPVDENAVSGAELPDPAVEYASDNEEDTDTGNADGDPEQEISSTDGSETDDAGSDDYGDMPEGSSMSEDVPADAAGKTPEQQLAASLDLPEDTPVIDYREGRDQVEAEVNSAMAENPEHLIFLNADQSLMDGECYDLLCDYYWADFESWCAFSGGQSGILVNLDYPAGESDEAASMQLELDEVSSEILSEIPSGADCWEKAKVIHDQLAERLTYDKSMSLPYIRSAYCIVTGDAVCLGYADAFSYLMEQAGEHAGIVSSSSHAWNLVSGYPGYDTFVDVTWDDTDSTSVNGTVYTRYAYFGLGYDEIISIEEHELNTDPVDYSSSGEAFNYYRRTGNYFDSYSCDALKNAFANQYGSGLKMLSVQFSDSSAYLEATVSLFHDNCSELNRMLGEIGYTGGYTYAYDDATRTIDIVL